MLEKSFIVLTTFGLTFIAPFLQNEGFLNPVYQSDKNFIYIHIRFAAYYIKCRYVSKMKCF